MTTWIKIKGTGFDEPTLYRCANCGGEDGADDCPRFTDMCCVGCGCECACEHENTARDMDETGFILYCLDCDEKLEVLRNLH